MILLQDSVSTDLSYTKVFLNGKWIGLHKNPVELEEDLKLMKLNSFIHIHTSIRWNRKTDEIHLFSDRGQNHSSCIQTIQRYKPTTRDRSHGGYLE